MITAYVRMKPHIVQNLSSRERMAAPQHALELPPCLSIPPSTHILPTLRIPALFILGCGTDAGERPKPRRRAFHRYLSFFLPLLSSSCDSLHFDPRQKKIAMGQRNPKPRTQQEPSRAPWKQDFSTWVGHLQVTLATNKLSYKPKKN